MADTKLSALTELAATPAVDDELYIRDVSEAAADESKQITTANLLASRAILTVAETEVYNAAAPVAWTDLDLSGTIGAQVSLVLLKIASTAGVAAVAFRKNGDTDEFYSVDDTPKGCALVNVNAVNEHRVALVATDAAGIIEWKAEAAGACTVDVIAYIK